MILACGPSGPGLLFILAVIFALPVISSIASIVGIAARSACVAWIGAAIGFLLAIPGVICLCGEIGRGHSPAAMMLLLAGGPMGLAIIALIRCLCRQGEQREAEFR